MAKIEVQNVSKTYGNVKAVDNLNLQIDDGEFLAIVGPSGSGKTTLLNIIAGFLKPDEGEILLDGVVANDLTPRERKLGMVFQDIALFSHMTVRENISFGLEIAKVPKEKIEQEVEKTAEKLGILRLLDKKPATLSGGEAQRVAIARTTITDPSIYLLDEPLGNLDAEFRRQLTTEIKRLHDSLKRTFIYVTHDQAQAMSMPDKVAVMKDGRFLQIGSPLEIYRKPINIFVAEFFGTPSINMVSGEFDDRRDEPRFISKTINLTLEDYAWAESLENYFGRQVIMGIRPENVQIRSAGVTDADGTGTVISTVNLGDRNLVHVDIGQDKPLVAFAPHSVQPNAGSTISFNVDKSGLIFFDPSNERRIAPT